MSEMQPQPHLSTRVLVVVSAHGPLTFTQIVHYTRAHRGSVWRVLKQLQQRGHVIAQMQCERVYYCAAGEKQQTNTEH